MKIILLLAILVFLNFNSYAQSSNGNLKVYFDCDDCNISYLKRNLDSINFAREAKVAEVHVMVTDRSTGGGGDRYYFHFIGRGDFEDINFELTYTSSPTQTELEVDDEMRVLIKSGLKPFIYTKNSFENLAEKNKKKLITPEENWNYWVFQIGSRIEYKEEASRNEIDIESEIDIDRITEELRIRFDFDHELEENKIDRKEGAFFSSLNRSNVKLSVVKSLGPKFSTGIFTEAWDNSVRNINIGYLAEAAIEYNFFPYKLSHVKQLTVSYSVGPRYFNYIDTTLFNQKRELLTGHRLAIQYDQVQPWGSIRSRIEGFHYFQDINMNSMEFEVDFYIRIAKGLFVNFNTEAELIHDQIYLPKGDASLEEILLERKALATDFEFEISVGFSYVFGATSNNIVNTRL